MKRLSLLLAAIMILALFPAISAGADEHRDTYDEPDWYVDEAQLPFDPIAGFEDSAREWGVHRSAGYRIEVPANWNGSLVIWAHGFRGEGLALTVDSHPLRDFLVPSGYAWAASSYRSNDYNVGDGVKDTKNLVDYFSAHYGEPTTTYITGASMGGHVTARSIEQYDVYDGAMPICGVVGDYALFDYFADYNVAGQQLGLGTSTFPQIDGLTYIGVDVPTIKANLEAFPGGWPVALNENGESFKQLVELRSGGDRPNFDEAWYFWNTFPSFASGPGNFLWDIGVGDGTASREPGVVSDNRETVYQFDLDPAVSDAEAEFNDEVARIRGSQALRRSAALNPIPVVTGDIDIPVLSLHNLGDMFVPFHNEVAYAQDVADHGKSDYLVQRAIRGVSHCGFTPTELVTAFVDLAVWVEFGVKPAGDVVLDPAIVAADDYGCQFTDFATEGGHVLATPCVNE